MSEDDGTIQLLIEDDANRTALAELLEGRYEVRTDDTELTGDVVLVDDFSVPTYRDRLESLGTSPSFSPVVLVRREGTRIDLDLTDSGDNYRLVDEVITAPVREPVLHRRLSNLLVRRRQFERLEEQNEQLERFASVVSHDLRNPLQVAQGRLDLLESSVADSEREHVEHAQESLDRMDSLISDVLALAREGNELENPTEVQLSTVVANAWSVVASRDADLVAVDEGAMVVADADRLSSVFENLFRNAVEHGRSDVTIEVGTTADGFYVADDGPGIPPEKRDDVLERGYSSAEGTGLGLDIVTSVVDAHGWELSVGESDTGGARFDVSGVELVRASRA
ncbi:HAMP domain-containing sensor histidine kinase [Natrialba sp. INN-245]|uniref:sensor histidine kinase n=1 Tax=Natrialba sp. INN-245 TaxID=2690967 RepID=UPI001312BB6B|nr:HAMP domain-containing sensor histidine kinase [Natrialba sp. INN-245]MWV40580.1 sensor histidine kinase [Natrialba sp. INN-245]